MKARCRCGASFKDDRERLAHYAWADKLPTERQRTAHDSASLSQGVLTP